MSSKHHRAPDLGRYHLDHLNNYLKYHPHSYKIVKRVPQLNMSSTSSNKCRYSLDLLGYSKRANKEEPPTILKGQSHAPKASAFLSATICPTHQIILRIMKSSLPEEGNSHTYPVICLKRHEDILRGTPHT